MYYDIKNGSALMKVGCVVVSPFMEWFVVVLWSPAHIPVLDTVLSCVTCELIQGGARVGMYLGFN